MSLSLPRPTFVLLALSALILTACASSDSPRRIAAFPAGDGPDVEERFLPLPDRDRIIYNADMELEVSDPDAAAGRVKDLADEFGGYLVSSSAWRQDGDRYYRLVIAVPAVYFEQLHDRYLDLGKLKRESVWGDPPPYGLSGMHNYSTITLQLLPKPGAWPEVQIGAWDPGRTFQQAFTVFLTIFGFVMDILIWLVVVAGPPVLLGYLVWWIIRAMRRRHADENGSDLESQP
jgi:hypothetical protein